MKPPVMRQPISTLVVLVVLDVDVLVVLEVDELVLELLEVELELLDELVLVDVLVVVTTSVPSRFSERNGWSTVESCKRPSFSLSIAPTWSPARTSATASNTPGLTFSVHVCCPPIAIAGVPAGRERLVVITIGLAKSGVPSAAGQ
jgi:hypothetical protein